MPIADQWPLIVDILVAFALCGTIGMEREWRQKSAGMRTHALVGVGAALFMVVSKYGFFDVLGSNVVVDPSRVAAQVVSGIGFIGGGVIFVRRDIVRGLTTAATVWLAAAVGMASGASLHLIALAVTVLYLIVTVGLTPLMNRLPRARFATSVLRVTYEDGRGLLRTIVQLCTAKGYFVADLEMVRGERYMRLDPASTGAGVGEPEGADGGRRRVMVLLELEGRHDPGELVHELGTLAGIYEVGVAEGYGDD